MSAVPVAGFGLLQGSGLAHTLVGHQCTGQYRFLQPSRQIRPGFSLSGPSLAVMGLVARQLLRTPGTQDGHRLQIHDGQPGFLPVDLCGGPSSPSGPVGPQTCLSCPSSRAPSGTLGWPLELPRPGSLNRGCPRTVDQGTPPAPASLWVAPAPRYLSSSLQLMLDGP